MKKLVLLIAVLGSVQALATGTSTTYYGIDDDRQECSVTVDGDGFYTLKTATYTFANLRAQEGEWGAKYFEDLTMDYGNNVYARVIGSPITISRIGILEVKGKLVSDGQGVPSSMDLKAVGGLMNWFSKQFVCSELK